jgi:hypothetical protein
MVTQPDESQACFALDFGGQSPNASIDQHGRVFGDASRTPAAWSRAPAVGSGKSVELSDSSGPPEATSSATMRLSHP